MTANFRKGKQLIIGIILGILTYWLFAQSLLNIAPHVQKDYNIDMSVVNIAVSLTSLLTGVFIVVAGGLSDKLGRVKIAQIGLILSIIGSACVILTNIPALLLAGRVFQGLSAACLLPSTIALINQFFSGEERQKALSYWSFGSYGGTGLASLFAGTIATYLNWRFIFVLSIIFAVIAMLMLKDIPESKDESSKHKKFDVMGIFIFVVMMISINIVITQGSKFGWLNPIILTLDAIFIITLILFYIFEQRQKHPFIDFSLFSNKVYIGTTIANLLVNTVIGSLALFNIFAQDGLHLTGAQAGLITIPYMIGSLVMIRVGERYMQKKGPQVPLMVGPIAICVGISLLALNFLPSIAYYAVALVGFSLIGLGLGFFATPALSTAVSNAPSEKVGMASGIIKMTSTLGAAFGIAVVTTVYATLAATQTPHVAATIALLVGAFMVLTAFIVAFSVIPKSNVET
ncbi:MFS transporter [Staphylococcus massiliensis]|uniref:Quinolone resistance protein NorB n=1 Tax=Staphylococcus massiliensis S46 TaxID=1229783 RepID=K9ARX4_9STAP|nr:MFS transporter [Staphylococcus massiliensis]EKU50049.1 major facilitator superfamily protein [Staphylococcus massiliensis S46]MCG3399192.1 MFS transporter [Staphylococcus massiliensis]MCG3402244.1 MFS transporter [Staphylococcus massiliensis]MCG3412788.1 MFS transporter [Staphylococcus massiliensis]POA00726.1 MFS transporter [Staphylococcus massiliensis CCUG 55927]